MNPPIAPRVRPLTLPDLDEGDARDLVAYETYELQHFASVDLAEPHLHLDGATFTECALRDWQVGTCSFVEATLSETAISGLFAAGFAAPRAGLRQVEIVAARIGSMELMDTKIRSVTVRDCRLGFVNLRGADLRDVRFVDCSFDGVDLGDAVASRVSFEGCRVGELDTTRATLAHVDLRGAQIARLTGVDGLGGATMTRIQLMEAAEFFAAHLGVAVAD